MSHAATWREAASRFSRLVYVRGEVSAPAVMECLHHLLSSHGPWHVALQVASYGSSSNRRRALSRALRLCVDQGVDSVVLRIHRQVPKLTCDASTTIARYRQAGWQASLSAAKGNLRLLGPVLGCVAFDCLRLGVCSPLVLLERLKAIPEHHEPHAAAFLRVMAAANASSARTDTRPSEMAALSCAAHLRGDWETSIALGLEYFSLSVNRNDDAPFLVRHSKKLIEHSVASAMLYSLARSSAASRSFLRSATSHSHYPSVIQGLMTLVAMVSIESSGVIDAPVLLRCFEAVTESDASLSSVVARDTVQRVIKESFPLLLRRLTVAGLWQQAIGLLETQYWPRQTLPTRLAILDDIKGAVPHHLYDQLRTTYGVLKIVPSASLSLSRSHDDECQVKLGASNTESPTALVVVDSASAKKADKAAPGVAAPTTWEHAMRLIGQRIQSGRIDDHDAIFATRILHAAGKWVYAAKLITHMAAHANVPPGIPPIAADIVCSRGFWFAALNVVSLYDRSTHVGPSMARAMLFNTFAPLISVAASSRRWADALHLYHEASRRHPAAASNLAAPVLYATTELPGSAWSDALHHLCQVVPTWPSSRSFVKHLLRVIAKRNPNHIDEAWSNARAVCPAATADHRTVPLIMHALSQCGEWARVVSWLGRHGYIADAVGGSSTSPPTDRLGAMKHFFRAVHTAAVKELPVPSGDELAAISRRLLTATTILPDPSSVDAAIELLKIVFRACSATGTKNVVLPRLAHEWEAASMSPTQSPLHRSLLRELAAVTYGNAGRYGQVELFLKQITHVALSYVVHSIYQWSIAGFLPHTSRMRHRVHCRDGSARYMLSAYCNRVLHVDITSVVEVNDRPATASAHLIGVRTDDVILLDITCDLHQRRADKALLPRLTIVGSPANVRRDMPVLVVSKPPGLSMESLLGLLPDLPFAAGPHWSYLYKLDPAEDGLTVWFPDAAPRAMYKVTLSLIIIVEPIAEDGEDAVNVEEAVRALQAAASVLEVSLLSRLPVLSRIMLSVSLTGSHYELPVALAAVGWRVYGDWTITAPGGERLNYAHSPLLRHRVERACFVEAVEVHRRVGAEQKLPTVVFQTPVPARLRDLWLELQMEERQKRRFDQNSEVASRRLSESHVTAGRLRVGESGS